MGKKRSIISIIISSIVLAFYLFTLILCITYLIKEIKGAEAVAFAIIIVLYGVIGCGIGGTILGSISFTISFKVIKMQEQNKTKLAKSSFIISICVLSMSLLILIIALINAIINKIK